MLSLELETKFHQSVRGSGWGLPPSSMARAGLAAGVGLGLWALALVQLRWFAVLARGRLSTRLCLGALGIIVTAALVYLVGPTPRSIALALIWLSVQIVVLVWARPKPSAETERGG